MPSKDAERGFPTFTIRELDLITIFRQPDPCERRGVLSYPKPIYHGIDNSPSLLNRPTFRGEPIRWRPTETILRPQSRGIMPLLPPFALAATGSPPCAAVSQKGG